MRKRRSVWMVLVPVLVLTLIQQAVSMFGMQILLVKKFANVKEGFSVDSMIKSLAKDMLNQDFLMAVYCGYALLAIIVFFIWYRSDSIRDAKNNGGFLHQDTLKGVSIKNWAGMLLFANGIQYLSNYVIVISSKAAPDVYESYQEVVDAVSISGSKNAVILTLLYVCLLGPVCEEICFRGLTYTLARGSMPHFGANLLQAILFAGFHANPLQALYTFVLALFLGNIVGKTGNLTLSIIIHIMFNTLSYVGVGYIGVGTTAVSFYCILLLGMMATYVGYNMILSRNFVVKKNEG